VRNRRRRKRRIHSTELVSAAVARCNIHLLELTRDKNIHATKSSENLFFSFLLFILVPLLSSSTIGQSQLNLETIQQLMPSINMQFLHFLELAKQGSKYVIPLPDKYEDTGHFRENDCFRK
jgi:hypothetical protein